MPIISGKGVITDFYTSGDKHADEVESNSKYFIHFDLSLEDKYAKKFAFDSFYPYRSATDVPGRSDYASHIIKESVFTAPEVLTGYDRDRFDAFYDNYKPDVLDNYFLLNRGSEKKYVTPWLFIPRDHIGKFSCILTGYIWHRPKEGSKKDSLEKLIDESIKIEVLGFDNTSGEWKTSASSGLLKAFWTDATKHDLGSTIQKDDLLNKYVKSYNNNIEPNHAHVNFMKTNSYQNLEFKSFAFHAESIVTDLDAAGNLTQTSVDEALALFLSEKKIQTVKHSTSNTLISQETDAWFFNNYSLPNMLGIEYIPSGDQSIGTELIRVKAGAEIIAQVAVNIDDFITQKVVHLKGEKDGTNVKLTQTDGYVATNVMTSVKKAYEAIGIKLEDSSPSKISRSYSDTNAITNWNISDNNSSLTYKGILKELNQFLIHTERGIEYGAKLYSSFECVFIVELDFEPEGTRSSEGTTRGIATRNSNTVLVWPKIDNAITTENVDSITVVHELAHSLGVSHVFKDPPPSYSKDLDKGAKKLFGLSIKSILQTVRKNSLHQAFLDNLGLLMLNETDKDKIRREKFFQQSITELHYPYRMIKSYSNYWMDYDTWKKPVYNVKLNSSNYDIKTEHLSNFRTDFARFHWDAIRHRIKVLKGIGE